MTTTTVQRRALLTLGLACLFIPAANAKPGLKKMEVDANSLDILDCVRLALSNRLDLRILDRAPENLADQAKGVKSAVLPSVNVEGAYTKSDKAQGGKFAQGNKESKTGKVRLSAPLYDFGGTPARVLTAEEASRAKSMESLRARQQVAAAITENYLDILEIQREQALVQESLKLVKEQLAASQDFFREGLVAKNDVLTVETRTLELKQELIRLENALHLKIASLNRQMGLPSTRKTRIKELPGPPKVKTEMDALMAAAKARRPDLEALAFQKASLMADRRAASKALLPGIGAFGELNWNEGNPFAHETTLTAGLGVRWQLFDSGVMKYNLKGKDRGIADVGDRIEELRQNVVLEVEQSWLGVREALDRLPVSRQGEAAAAENLRVIREQYGRGLATSADVLQEEERLARAHRSTSLSITSLYRNLGRLKLALGLDPLTPLERVMP